MGDPIVQVSDGKLDNAEGEGKDAFYLGSCSTETNANRFGHCPRSMAIT
jgi:hypothetical protein